MKKFALIAFVVIVFSCAENDQLNNSEQDGLKSAGIKKVDLIGKSDVHYINFVKSNFFAEISKNWKVLETGAELISLDATKDYQLVGFKTTSQNDILVGVYNVINQEYVNVYVHGVENSYGVEHVSQFRIDGKNC